MNVVGIDGQSGRIGLLFVEKAAIPEAKPPGSFYALQVSTIGFPSHRRLPF